MYLAFALVGVDRIAGALLNVDVVVQCAPDNPNLNPGK